MSDRLEQAIEKIHEAVGTKDLANKLARLLIEADEFAAINGAIMAIALWQSDPDITKDNAMTLAHDLGKLVADEINENWDMFVETRRKMQRGELW